MDLGTKAIERLAERLTLAGLEVEHIVTTGRLEGGVVGKVVSCRPHPDSHHLSLCHVDVGSKEVEIICGAQNVAAGNLVPVVTVGGQLPNGLRIEARKIRGVHSNGMICSKAELGLEERSSGIWNFDSGLDVTPGMDLNDLLEFEDTVLDIKVTSNRPDCMGVYGIAREVAAITGQSLRPLTKDVRESLPPAREFFSVEVADPEDAPRYAVRLMDGISPGSAPLWMQYRLFKAGMRSVSNVVDVTNYVMLELGHPLHPFDADLVNERVLVRRARDGERFRTLDGVDRELSSEVLMIADRDGGVAIAGVMGGERSEIREETTRVLLEVAAFDPITIRRSSRSVGIRSEAAQRFERGVDPECVPLAADRVAHLLQRLTDCRVHQGMVDVYPRVRRAHTVRLRPSRVTALLGLEFDRSQIVEILRRLKIEVGEDGDDLVATVPTFRADLTREVDLIEEVGRIHGYDKLPSVPPVVPLRAGKKDALEIYKDRVRSILTGLGVNEVVTDGFDKAPWREALGMPVEDLVGVLNPMSAAQQAALRWSLLPGILSVVETNLSRRVDGGMLFEVGRVFSKTRGEHEALGGALFGRSFIPLQGKREVSLGEAKGILEDLFAGLGLEGLRLRPDGLPSLLHPQRGGRVLLDETPIGFVGELALGIRNAFPGTPRVIVFELDLEALHRHAAALPRFSPFSRFPASKRDLSLLAPVDLAEASIRKALCSEDAVEHVLLYDLYQGEQVPSGFKSLTYEVSLRAPDRTFTDDEVAEILSRIEKRLAKLHVRLRT
jgi:phenylalanyl-tRNA synthetase beta chain